VLVTDYIQKCESEMEEINSKIEHLKQQEARWQELENTVKLLSQLQHKYVDEISER
jgi:CII-binding regulator of phage lambda lysogenization HflD